jgi:hypothetical protein
MLENFFERKLDSAAGDGKEDKKTLGQKAIFNADQFFAEHGQAIEDYAEDRGLIFRCGSQWAINMEKGEATYDPNFFAEKGYSAAETMWATCHEIEHFRDWRRDPETYSSLFRRFKYHRRLHILYNCLDDILVNRQVDERFPAHRQTKESLYREKLFPGTDYQNKPKHLQFVYTMLREKMLPEEILNLDSKVREEIERLRDIDREGTDLISLVGDPEAKPRDRFEIIHDYIEPIYEKFFQEDVEEKKKQKQEKGEGEKGEEGGEPQNPEEYFSGDYDDFDDKMPQSIPIDDIKDTLDKYVKKQKEDAKKTSEQIAKEQFEKEHGVSAEEMENYRADYEKIKQYIEPLRAIFERIISQRKEIKRRLKERTEQGVILDPSLISQVYIDAQSGILDSRTQLKVKKIEYDENKPNNFEFTLVCDLSGSMDQNQPGGKSYEQKFCAILVMEALAEFEEKLKRERVEKTMDLRLLTEIRGFGDGDEELKPLSDMIDYQTRIKIAKRLSRCDGGSTQDFESLAKIDRNINEKTRHQIEKNDLKKVVLLITDGGSDNVRLAKKEKEALVKAGVITKAVQIGDVSASDREKFKEVWLKPQKDGQSCKNVSQLVSAVEKLLEKFLSDL